MGWRIFEEAAEEYEAWYATPNGERADRAERRLLRHLLRAIPDASTVLEVGCGTGHFTAWFAELGLTAFGLDRSSAMLAALRRHRPSLPAVLGDASELPIRDGGVDVTAFIASLEFLEAPELALQEAVRVSRQGLILVALNAWSAGGMSRRWGAQAHSDLLGKARDYSLPRLAGLARAAALRRLGRLCWTSALFPFGPAECLAPVPIGDVIGVAVTLNPPDSSSG